MLCMKQALAFVLTWGILVATSPARAASLAPPNAFQEAAGANLSASQIDELVSPIALYPDALVAQIVAASTYPDQVSVPATLILNLAIACFFALSPSAASNLRK